MIRIAPEELTFAEKLAQVRRSFQPSDGAKSWPRYHELIYEGSNKLIFRTTDLRISLVSKLPVEGEDQPWRCRVFIKNFAGQAKFSDGGRYTLDSSPPRCVRVGKGVAPGAVNLKVAQALPGVATEDVQFLPEVDDNLIPGGSMGELDAPIANAAPPTPSTNDVTLLANTAEATPPQNENDVTAGNAGGLPAPGELARTPNAPDTNFRYQYPFWKVPVDTPFPEMLAFDPDHPAPRISLDKIRRALRFLMASRREKDPECRLNICSIMPNQLIGTWNDGVFVQADGPTVAAPVNLASADAFRLAQWLQLLHWQKETELQIAQKIDEQGKATTLFATPNMDHFFQVRSLCRAFPTEFFTNLQGVEKTIRGSLSRQELRSFAGCFSHFANCHLIFAFRKEGGQWTLHLTPTREVPIGGGPIPISVEQCADGMEEIPTFHGSAAQLLTAVEYHQADSLRFTLRQRAKTLSLCRATDDGNGGAEAIYQTHVRVRFNVTTD